jgi:hypothetical protein
MPADPPLAIPEWVSYDLHGHWVRYVETGAIGRIGYHDTDREFAAVVWEEGTQPRALPDGQPDAIDSWFALGDLELIDRDPTPWYKFEDIERRRRKDRTNESSGHDAWTAQGGR